MGFSGGSVVKNPHTNAGDTGLIPGSENTLEKERQHIPIFLPGKSYRKRSLVGYSPWGHKRIGQDLATKQQQQKKNVKLAVPLGGQL